MKAVCLLFHDVVENAEWESSGFVGPGTARYKLSRAEFEAHLGAIASVRDTPPCIAQEFSEQQIRQPQDNSTGHDALSLALTFDDGGESAATRVASILGKYGWRGHFFVTAGRIGTKGFMTPDQIRGLRRLGHVIGSHSFSHPMRMSHCSREQLMNEWTKSVNVLSDILGEPVDTASVPGGYYSSVVGETAAACGICVLFNSEPTTTVHNVNGCIVVGRYNIFRGTAPAVSADLVSIRSRQRSQQWFYWNFKKVAKTIAGGPYLAARQLLLRKE